MPSYLRYPRSFSFPPFLDNDNSSPFSSQTPDQNLPDIDEDPFAHFLAPLVEEDDPYDGLSLSAGIEVSDPGARTSKTSKFKSNVADKWARYVKLNHVQLHQHYHEHDAQHEQERKEVDVDEDSFMMLDDDRLVESPNMVPLLSSPPRITLTVTEPTRGRAQELVSASGRKMKRRRYSRTLSGHRHSWREPSPDLFTVEESEEDTADVLTLRRIKTKTKDGEGRRRSQMDIGGTERSRL